MKKFIIAALALILAFSCAIPAFAASEFELKVNASAENIVIDGVVTTEEWGQPIFTTTPDKTLANQSKGWDYWSFTPAPAGQYFELYVTNDAENIYIAGKLIGAKKDTSCPEIGKLWQYPHLTVTFAMYDKGLVCPKIEYQEQFYEQYTCYSTGFVKGNPAQQCTSQGMDTPLLEEDEFAVAYSDEEKAYIYEYKIPYEYTNVDVFNMNKICLGLDITDAPEKVSDTMGGNRYLVSKAGERGMAWFGPNNFYFQTTNPLIIELSSVEAFRTEKFYAEKLVERQTLPPTDPYYYENYEFMSVTAICAAAAAIFAAAAAVVVVLKKKKK